jgi:hypothetical protein
LFEAWVAGAHVNHQVAGDHYNDRT